MVLLEGILVGAAIVTGLTALWALGLENWRRR